MFAKLRQASCTLSAAIETSPESYGDGGHIRRAFVPVGFMALAVLPMSLGAHYLGFPATVAPLAAALAFLLVGQGASIGRPGRVGAVLATLFVALAGSLEIGLVVALDEAFRAPLSLLATVTLVTAPLVRLRRDAMRRLSKATQRAEIQSRLLRSVIEDPIAVVDRGGRLHAATDGLYDEPDRGWPSEELLDRVHVLDRPKLLNALDRSAVACRPTELEIRIDRSSCEDACSFSAVHISLAPMPQEGLVRLSLHSAMVAEACRTEPAEESAEAMPNALRAAIPLQAVGA